MVYLGVGLYIQPGRTVSVVWDHLLEPARHVFPAPTANPESHTGNLLTVVRHAVIDNVVNVSLGQNTEECMGVLF